MAQLMIAAGGTGGHVYPALAVAEVLHKSNATHNLTFIGTRGGGGFEKRLVDASDISFDSYGEVFAGPVVGVAPLRALSSIVKMSLGLLQSIFLILRQHPQAILLTGGWANVPLAVAGWLMRIPMLIYLPDIEPGTTIRVLSRFVKKIATTVPESARYFREGQTVTTGYPLRSAMTSATRVDALTYFGLDPERKTLLVTGGSRGARSINIALGDILPDLLEENVQILHVTGKLDYERTQNQTAHLLNNPHYHLHDYLDSEAMGLAFASADIVLGRSGASALGEFPYFGAASLLVPYPYAWRYQRVNADWLAEHGAGIRINDEDMAQDLLPILQSLLRNDEKLAQFQSCAKNLFSGNGSENIARELLSLTGGSDS